MAIDDGNDGSADLQTCPNCERNFAADRIDRHIQVCTSQKKRKVFDMTKMRVQGTEAAAFVLGKKGRQAQPEKKPKPNSWRTKHEEFISAIRYAKMAGKVEKEGGSLANLPPPPVSSNPDYVQCPHCMRRFNQVAAERHMYVLYYCVIFFYILNIFFQFKFKYSPKCKGMILDFYLFK